MEKPLADALREAGTPPLGVMVVARENFSGMKEANLLRIGGEPGDD